jgi:hypothetical protein
VKADELHQAIINLPTKTPHHVSGYGDYELGHKNARHAAAELVAEFASQLHPADDGEAVRGEWAAHIGWREHFIKETQVSGYVLGRATQTGCLVTTARLVCLDDDEDSPVWSVEIAQHEPHKDPKWPSGIGILVTTRGAVRRLLAALGIELKEQSQ